MRFITDQLKNPIDGNWSVVKVGAFAGIWTLHVALLVRVWRASFGPLEYVFFALGIAIVSGMPIANHYVNALARAVPGASHRTTLPPLSEEPGA